MSELSPGRRVLLHEYGESPLEAVDQHMTIEDMAAPDPAGLGPEDVIVAVRSAAVGWVDLIMASGQYQHQAGLPYTPGLEYAGDVVWVGAAVDPKRLKVGDRVFADGFLVGPRSGGAYQNYGGFASYAVAPASALLPIPAGFGYDEACNFLGSYETAWHCLVKCGNIQAGETVLIHGASGATGLAAVHVAKLMGANVIATGRNADKLAVVQAQGADHIIQTGSDEPGGVRRFRDDVKALTGGKGADVVYDGVGGAISLETLRCLRFGARYLIVGWAGTPNVARGKGQRGAPNANMLPTNLIMMKGLHVMGCPTVISTIHDPSIRPPRQKALYDWVEAGKLKPYISQRYTLEQALDALRDKWSGKFVGGAVINP